MMLHQNILLLRTHFVNFVNKDVFIAYSAAATEDNEKADSVAKSALGLPRVKAGVPYTDHQHHSNKYCPR